jgi:hypothetical protein
MRFREKPAYKAFSQITIYHTKWRLEFGRRVRLDDSRIIPRQPTRNGRKHLRANIKIEGKMLRFRSANILNQMIIIFMKKDSNGTH